MQTNNQTNKTHKQSNAHEGNQYPPKDIKCKPLTASRTCLFVCLFVCLFARKHEQQTNKETTKQINKPTSINLRTNENTKARKRKATKTQRMFAR